MTPCARRLYRNVAKHLEWGASRHYHRNAGFIRERPAWLVVLPDKSGVPDSGPSLVAGSVKMHSSRRKIFRPIPIFITRLDPFEVAVVRCLFCPIERRIQIVLSGGGGPNGGVLDP